MSRSSSTLLGSVQSLWRYPVKSMQGEELDAAEITERGLLGDRAYALIDKTTTKVVSAKNPRRWGSLLGFKAAFCEPPRFGEPLPPVRITFPDGTVVRSDQVEADRMLSSALCSDVTLTTTPPRAPTLEECSPGPDGVAGESGKQQPLAVGAPSGTFFDFAATHVLTSATLQRLRELSPSGRFEPCRFRPNIVIESAPNQTGFAENAWVGQTLAIADGLRLQVATPCPRCVMTTLPQGDLPDDPAILRTVALHNKAFFAPLARSLPSVGVYAVVSMGGTIQRGDPVYCEKTPLVRTGAFWLSLVGTVLRRQFH